MIKVILDYLNNSVDYDETPYKLIYAKDEEEFWKKYNSNNEYIKCEDEFEGAFSVYLKKDKIIEVWFEKTTEVEDENI